MNSSISLAENSRAPNHSSATSLTSFNNVHSDNFKGSEIYHPPGNQLYLKINCNCANNLVPQHPHTTNANAAAATTTGKKKYSSSKSVNPILVVQLNDTVKSTCKKLNTNQPSWNDEIYMPLRNRDVTSLLVFSVWDKHRRYKNYLGELRLDIKDLFITDNGKKFTEKTELKWYQLSSNTDLKTFVTGAILVSFELVIKTNKKKFSMSQLSIEPHNVESSFIAWMSNLITSPGILLKNKVNTNEQGFYDDTLINGSDLESVLTDRSGAPSVAVNKNLLAIPSEDPGSYSDASIVSTDGYLSDVPNGLFAKEPTSPKKSRFRSKIIRKIKEDSDKFEMASRQVLGVVFIEIVSVDDLPPCKNFTRTSFDMDPFVVVSFGKRTFRTGWKRHTLNPVFNERIAFEILPHENNFSIQFLVLDKDHFSFHDDVAHISLPLRDLTEYATVKPTDSDDKIVNRDSNLVLNGNPNDDANDNEHETGYHTDVESDTASKNDFTTRDDESPTNSSVQILGVDSSDGTAEFKKKKLSKLKRKKVTPSSVDPSKFRLMSLSLNLHDQKYIGNYSPKLKIRVRFETYKELRKQFWRVLLNEYHLSEANQNCYDYIELASLLDTLGCNNSDELVDKFYANLNKSTWGGDLLTYDEIIDQLEKYLSDIKDDNQNAKLFEFEKCPICHQKKIYKKPAEDIITHFAICSSKDWSGVSKILSSSYVTPAQATKKWVTKALIKLTYGKYKLGENSANILVQDRMTGIILEEKISVYVRLGIRLLYKGLDKAKSKRVRMILKRMSYKQGSKYDSPQSKQEIKGFISFHKLNLDDCLIQDPSKFETFNDFFYRKLKPNARLIEAEGNDKIISSPADCRCVVFDTIDEATKLWIKGTGFTVQKLIHEDQQIDIPSYSLGIFRLAPQDYHRFHSPVEGTIESIKDIDGEYYTVNPMAIRSQLDVFGENVRSIITIRTKNFQKVYMVAVGAMMVGSIVLTKELGDDIKRGEEIGYFKFGGSTVILLIEGDKFKFDSDLVKNSSSGLETLVRVGQSIGHSPDIEEFRRDHIAFEKLNKQQQLKLIRVLTGGDLKDKHQLSNWEASNLVLEDIDAVEYDQLISDEVSIEGT